MEAYLDNSATTKPFDSVVEAVARNMREIYYNPSSNYDAALSAAEVIAGCRSRIARVLKCRPEEVILTSGGTEANNLAITGAAMAVRGRAHIVISSFEHPSVEAPARALEEAGHRLSIVNVNGDGQPDWDELAALLGESPTVVSVMQVNNETGAAPDISRLSEMTRRISPSTLLHVDGVQGFMRMSFDARCVDVYSLSAHKIGGPKGMGALCLKGGTKVKPLIMGGGQQGDMRSGTENTPGASGLSAAIDEMASISDMDGALREKKRAMRDMFISAAPGASVLGPPVEGGAPHIITLSFPPVRGEVMVSALSREGVYCSTGSACSSHKKRTNASLTAMGVDRQLAESALRFSVTPLTTMGEIEYAATKIEKCYREIKRYVRR